MTVLDTPKLIGFPPAPSNGGALQSALPKVGEWAWQPKFDDRRVAIHAPTSTIYNQYGELSIADRQRDKFGAALERLAAIKMEHCEWLDGGLMEYRHDMMRGCIVIFDTMDVLRPFWMRRAGLQVEFKDEVFDPDSLLKMNGSIRDRVFLTPSWQNRDPLVLEGWYQALNAGIGRKFFEGQVAKRSDARYPLGLKPKQVTPLWVKHRFDQ